MEEEYSAENSDDDVADGMVPDSRIIEIIDEIELAKDDDENLK